MMPALAMTFILLENTCGINGTLVDRFLDRSRSLPTW
jgi:hypothetical protein